MEIRQDARQVDAQARFVQAATLAVGLVATAVFAVNVLRVADGVDNQALRQEAGALDKGLDLVSELAAAEAVSVTVWDEAFRNTAPSPSQSWLKRNLGRAVFSEPWKERVALMEPGGGIAFESSRNGPPAPSEAGAILSATRPLLARLDESYAEARRSGEIDRRIGNGLVEGVYEAGFVRLNDRPVLVVAAPILPDVDDHDLPARPAILLNIRYLTDEFLAGVGEMAHLEGVRIAGAGAQSTRPVIGVDGSLVAFLAWDHTAPGSVVLSSMRPVLLASALVVLVMALSIGMLLRRQADALAAGERAALFAARHDAATGLANRRWFMEEGARVAATGGSVILIDCDYFKAINDTLGHAAGDAVLAAVAQRLAGLECLAFCARLGGDEFAALTPPYPADPEQLAMLLDEVADALMRPVLFEGRPIAVSVSIGAAPTGQDLAAALPRADAALYRAKRDGRGCWRMFDAGLDLAAGADEVAFAREERALARAA